jgi:membrane-associated protein
VIDFFLRVIDFVLHFDKHLFQFVELYGAWVYGILFAIVFAETGLVVTPFLPGDSLLFATGALAGAGALNIWLCAGLLIAASILGDAVNYAVGRYVGPRAFSATDTAHWTHRLLNQAHLRTSSSSTMAGRRSSWAGSCRSCARSCRSWRAPGR